MFGALGETPGALACVQLPWVILGSVACRDGEAACGFWQVFVLLGGQMMGTMSKSAAGFGWALGKGLHVDTRCRRGRRGILEFLLLGVLVYHQVHSW